MPIDSGLLPRDDEKDEDLARAWIAFEKLPSKSEEWYAAFWTWERMHYLTSHLPQRGWRVIQLIWSMDRSVETIQRLSAGPIEDLLSKNGEQMIGLVEAEARRDPAFASLLGGVWRKNRISAEVWQRLQAVWDRRGWDPSLPVNPDLLPRPTFETSLHPTHSPKDDEKDEELARAWLALNQSARKSEEHKSLFWAHERTQYLARRLPHKAWRIILLIWSIDQSPATMQNLSAGLIEDLLATNGEQMIALVEDEARREPSFAKLLGGVWKNQMTDEVWQRLQAVWDRRGWDGIPE